MYSNSHALFVCAAPRLSQNPLLVSEDTVSGAGIPPIKFGVPQGSFAPFWIMLRTTPFIFPTMSPWFIIPGMRQFLWHYSDAYDASIYSIYLVAWLFAFALFFFFCLDYLTVRGEADIDVSIFLSATTPYLIALYFIPEFYVHFKLAVYSLEDATIMIPSNLSSTV